uniref:EGF-like domain-containing protein n=1 Tax=Spongospora subterranea TaxID=70186 RepID=A0A0H5QSM1_9EUKA|eukprot:CRZ04945.1 hypothetical protein [Spongospora subterranea]
MSSDYLLVNNLDLVVTSTKGGVHWVGNQRLPTPSTDTSLHRMLDTLNNVEQVAIDVAALDTYDILVSGNNVPKGPQLYSLTVTGQFEQRPVSECQGSVTVCPNSCSVHGRCTSEGLCECFPEYAGFDCSFASSAMKAKAPNVASSVAVGQWVFYHFDIARSGGSKDVLTLPSGVTCIQVVAATGSDLAHPEVFVSRGRMPNMATADWLNQSRRNPVSLTIRDNHSLLNGRYYVGVFGGCCNTAELTLTVTATCGPMSDSVNASGIAGIQSIEPSGTMLTAWITVISLLMAGSVVAVAAVVIRMLTTGGSIPYMPIEKSQPRTAAILT